MILICLFYIQGSQMVILPRSHWRWARKQVAREETRKCVINEMPPTPSRHVLPHVIFNALYIRNPSVARLSPHTPLPKLDEVCPLNKRHQKESTLAFALFINFLILRRGNRVIVGEY